MHRAIALLFILTLWPLAVLAEPPTDESIDTLLGLARAETQLESVYGMMDQATRQTIASAAAGRNLTEEQKQSLEAAMKKITDVMRAELSWQSVRPMYVQIYKETFTQEEIDGLIAFYSSPVGASFINKMPYVMQRSMVLMQGRIPGMMAKIRESVRQAVDEAKIPK